MHSSTIYLQLLLVLSIIDVGAVLASSVSQQMPVLNLTGNDDKKIANVFVFNKVNEY